MAVPYGTTTSLTYTIQRGEPVRIQLPGLLEDHPHDLTGIRWNPHVEKGTIPSGLRLSLIDNEKGNGKYVYLTGTTYDPANPYASRVVARTNYTLNGKPRPVTWILTLNLEEGESSDKDNGSGGSGSGNIDPPPVNPVITIAWPAAKEAARAGQRIRMIAWADRWLEFDRGLWFLVVYTPISLKVTDRRVVQTTDQDIDWYTGQWTTSGIPGA